MEETGEKRGTDPWDDLARRIKESKKARVDAVEGGAGKPPQTSRAKTS
jgi:hypothetical protein